MNIPQKIRNRYNFFIDNLHYGSFGRKSRIIKPMRVFGKKRIYIGDHVYILNNARIETIRRWNDVECNGKLVIGNGTSIEQSCHIIASDEVIIGKNCVFSAFVYISDCSHQYSPDISIMASDLIRKKVRIGDHVFIGIGSCIMPGVTLGNNVVIGANSVVVNDIPENCMAAGSPAKIIKKWNGMEWQKI